MSWIKGIPDEPGRYLARWPAFDQTAPGATMEMDYLGDGLALMDGEYVLEASALQWGTLQVGEVSVDAELVEAFKRKGIGTHGG